jgi:hypothetical protein
MNETVLKYLTSEDPLSEDAIIFILNYNEEDDYVDYKETFDDSVDKEWIELTKDIMAFANSNGGYLLFGVQDSTYQQIGLSDETSSILKNIDQMQQKINRYIEPEILNIRSKEYLYDNKLFVVILIPVSPGKTHVVSKDAKFKFPSGTEKVILHKGTIYIRRSGGNHLCNSRDIDELFTKRMRHFRESLLENITRIVEAPPESDVYILSQDPTVGDNKKFIIEDGPDSIKVKGMSFTISPETIEEEISAWIALFKKNLAALPPTKTLWRWYFDREKANLSEEQKLDLAKFCLVSDVPGFFWLKGCRSKSIEKMLAAALDIVSRKKRVGIIIGVAAFLGKTSYSRILKKAKKKYGDKIPPKFLKFPTSDPTCLFSLELIDSFGTLKSQSSEQIRTYLINELDDIVSSVERNDIDEPDVIQRRTAHAIDCKLYAQNDKYK